MIHSDAQSNLKRNGIDGRHAHRDRNDDGKGSGGDDDIDDNFDDNFDDHFDGDHHDKFHDDDFGNACSSNTVCSKIGKALQTTKIECLLMMQTYSVTSWIQIIVSRYCPTIANRSLSLLHLPQLTD